MIGLFDSGVGGLSIVQAVQRALPDQDLLYFADSGHAPYGERAPAFVLERARTIARELLARRCSAIVVACNTASAIAVNSLRAEFSTRFIAVEPAVKPALASSASGVIAVMATANTLSSARFARLCTRLLPDKSHAAHAPHLSPHGNARTPRIVPVPCPGLAEAIEQGLLGTARLDQLLEQLIAPLAGSGADTVTLGCTHYAFAATQIHTHLRRVLGDQVRLVDNADGVAKQVAKQVAAHSLGRVCVEAGNSAQGGANLQILTTGDVAIVSRVAQQLLGSSVTVTGV